MILTMKECELFINSVSWKKIDIYFCVKCFNDAMAWLCQIMKGLYTRDCYQKSNNHCIYAGQMPLKTMNFCSCSAYMYSVSGIRTGCVWQLLWQLDWKWCAWTRLFAHGYLAWMVKKSIMFRACEAESMLWEEYIQMGVLLWRYALFAGTTFCMIKICCE